MDLPALGYDGLKQELRDHVNRSIRDLMSMIIMDKLLHAAAVADGAFTFRARFGKDMGAFFHGNRGQCDHLANVVYAFLEQSWKQRYPDMAPDYFLDKVHVPSPLSEAQEQAEIDDAWELEIASDERTVRQFYEGSARVRKGRDLGVRTSKPTVN